MSYCPIISRIDHNPLVYDPPVIAQARRLKLERVNFTQVDHNNLIELLRKQITSDCTNFYKEKEVTPKRHVDCVCGQVQLRQIVTSEQNVRNQDCSRRQKAGNRGVM